jgi:glycosyltransferase involved in cell wall biosynthesis
MASPQQQSRRIAVSLPALEGGGAELVILRLAEGLVARGIATDLVVARATGGLAAHVPDGVRLIDLGARPPVVLTKTTALARYLRSTSPDALISILDVVNAAMIAKRLSNASTRVVLSVQTNLTQQFRDKPDRGAAALRRALTRALYPRTDALVAASQGVANDVAAITGVDPRRITVIPNPIVTPDLERRAQEPAAHRFFAGDAPVVIGVGRLVRQKDFATLVRAFARIRATRDARLIILGAGDPREAETESDLRRLVAELGLEADVDVAGWVDNPAAYMARADVFALSSVYEGFGNVVAEALAVGTPVVSTDCPSGPAEILEGGRHGRLVPIGDDAALADAVIATLAEPPDRLGLRRRADRYRTERIVDEYLSVIDGVPISTPAD